MLTPFLRHSGTIWYRQPSISRHRVWPLHPSGLPCRSYGTGRLRLRREWLVYSTSAIVLATAGVIAFETSQPFRYTVHAIGRCSRVASSSAVWWFGTHFTYTRHLKELLYLVLSTTSGRLHKHTPRKRNESKRIRCVTNVALLEFGMPCLQTEVWVAHSGANLQ